MFQNIAVGDGDAGDEFVSCVMPSQLFGQKFGCYLGKLWGKNENLVFIWAKFDIRKMNEIWLLPMWVCPNIDFNKKFVLRFRGVEESLMQCLLQS